MGTISVSKAGIFILSAHCTVIYLFEFLDASFEILIFALASLRILSSCLFILGVMTPGNSNLLIWFNSEELAGHFAACPALFSFLENLNQTKSSRSNRVA